MYYEPFASTCGLLFSSSPCCTLDRLTLQRLKQFLPLDARARTSVGSLSGNAFKETLKQSVWLFARTNSCRPEKLPIAWH